jgi:hypothetical protein
MKNPALRQYLVQSYQRDVLRKPIKITPLTATSDMVDEIKAEIARIDALRLGANLAQRDYASYQARRALVALLDTLAVTATMSPTEAADKANFRK